MCNEKNSVGRFLDCVILLPRRAALMESGAEDVVYVPPSKALVATEYTYHSSDSQFAVQVNSSSRDRYF